MGCQEDGAIVTNFDPLRLIARTWDDHPTFVHTFSSLTEILKDRLDVTELSSGGRSH